MKALLIGNRARFEKFMPSEAPLAHFAQGVEKVYVDMQTPAEAYPAEALDADVIAADSIARVPASLIERMPKLRLICAEGVGYNGIDVAAAKARGVAVCNNKGVNADAVAEQAILLMLGLLRSVVPANEAVCAGRQIQIKETLMVQGITELSECRVGLIGFGDIAKALALRLHAFGCEVYYNTRAPKDAATEAACHATWLPKEELLARCDIVSLHIPANAETANTVDEAFLRGMKPTAYLINTARGELVENAALVRALTEGWIAGAALDTVAPEPVPADHPLLQLPQAVRSRLLFSPHIGGITTATFRKAHRGLWENFRLVSEGKAPNHLV
jgi:phosphoglycerate dehydrogenase-like enzyme